MPKLQGLPHHTCPNTRANTTCGRRTAWVVEARSLEQQTSNRGANTKHASAGTRHAAVWFWAREMADIGCHRDQGPWMARHGVCREAAPARSNDQSFRNGSRIVRAARSVVCGAAHNGQRVGVSLCVCLSTQARSVIVQPSAAPELRISPRCPSPTHVSQWWMHGKWRIVLHNAVNMEDAGKHACRVGGAHAERWTSAPLRCDPGPGHRTQRWPPRRIVAT